MKDYFKPRRPTEEEEMAEAAEAFGHPPETIRDYMVKSSFDIKFD